MVQSNYEWPIRPEAILCGWWDVKTQEQTNLSCHPSAGTCSLFVRLVYRRVVSREVLAGRRTFREMGAGFRDENDHVVVPCVPAACGQDMQY